ncbi:MAG: riboflavin biosynthesis protein RibF [Endomicrobia bacterium]|nr:riboflavin biosynthesis protein RibF [Endomicrobiia bacterium]MCL2506699.1 riboflavin biosynthesis protein RibF [Endomicrobiia bacterium]
MNKKSVITIGTFDGIHKGHRLLIERTLSDAKKDNLKSVAIVLERPFRNVSGLLSLYDEKIEELSLCGVDEIIIIPVPSDILSVEPDEFFDGFLVEILNAKKIVCGQDFAFGKNRKGNTDWLKNKAKTHGIKIDVIKPLKISSKQVSSSYIRMLIEKGDIKNVNKFLGRNYSFNGMPFKDRGIGKKLGFPTVNLKVDKSKLIPKGIFVSLISQGGKIYPSVTSIGTRPTFENGYGQGDGGIDHSLVNTPVPLTIPETHILDFNGNWKKSKTKVTLIKKIRNEKKFKTAEELKKQISKDVSKAKKYFGM